MEETKNECGACLNHLLIELVIGFFLYTISPLCFGLFLLFKALSLIYNLTTRELKTKPETCTKSI